MIFCTGTGYAIRALAALQLGGPFTLAKELAEQTELPAPYLSKVLQHLSRAGILESSRGPHGGFRLARPAGSITIGEVVTILNAMPADLCVMGFSECPRRLNACPLNEAWCEAKATLDENLAQVTIQDMAHEVLHELKLVPRVRPGESLACAGPGPRKRRA
jgi:Rrf2 family protein